MTHDVYITGCGSYLPGDALDNDEIVHRLGASSNGRAAKVRERVLAANGITTRHYALDESGRPTMLNDELAAAAVVSGLKDRGLEAGAIGMLAAATTQGDVLVPGFGSMVHGRLGGGPVEVLSAGGVCASSIAALAGAERAIRLGEHEKAIAVGSELVSRSLRQTRVGARPDPLTGREVEVLRLAAEGLDNATIADRLTLSVRTVERHLSNAYLKLGVTGKTARTAAVAHVLSR